MMIFYILATSPLAPSFRLGDEGFRFPFDELISKIAEIGRQIPSRRKEIVLFRELLEHLHQILSKVVFSGQRVHSGEVVNFLMGW